MSNATMEVSHPEVQKRHRIDITGGCISNAPSFAPPSEVPSDPSINAFPPPSVVPSDPSINAFPPPSVVPSDPSINAFPPPSVVSSDARINAFPLPSVVPSDPSINAFPPPSVIDNSSGSQNCTALSIVEDVGDRGSHSYVVIDDEMVVGDKLAIDILKKDIKLLKIWYHFVRKIYIFRII